MDAATETGKRIARTEAYAEKLRRLFAATVNEILAMNKTIPSLEEGVMFSFDGQSVKKQKEVEGLLRRLHSLATLSIEKGMELEWEKANDECDKLLSSIFGKGVLETPQFAAWLDRNTNAMRAFIERSDAGLNLSDRVWRSVRQLRDEMEIAMTVAIGEGDSASSISRKVRQYLNDPDLMFRRFRYKAGEEVIFDDEGNEIGRKPIYGKKWKKRIKDEATGKYRWIDYDRDSYKTGSGVYKSSAKNAMRVARTETNMAYRRADNERWKRMDFVLGQRIQLSNSHPVRDICDTLAGDYPKEFIFEGWHPQCFCFVTPILMDEDEMARMSDAFIEGKEYKPKGKPVKDYPDKFKDWVKDNSEKIMDAHDNMRDPYFVRHNWAIVNNILHPKMSIQERARIRHEARTQDQIDDIKARAAERQKKHALIRKTADNVLKVASDYGEVDYSKLKQFITEGNLTAMQAESKIIAKMVSSIKKQEIALSDLIPDVHIWHKQFSMAELEAVHDAVKKKLDDLSGLSLQKQADKLTFEIKYVADPSKYKYGAVKYPTWEVSQSAYLKKLDEVTYKIDVKQVKDQLDVVQAWSLNHPKSKKVADLLADAQYSIDNEEDLFIIKQKAQLAINEHQKRLAEQARRDAKKASKNISFDADAYSQERKDAAVWTKDKDRYGLYDRKSGDSYFRKFAEDDWRRWDDNEKDVAYLYTSGSSYINEPTYTTYYSTKYGLKGEIRDSWKDINTLTKMIDESTPFTRDVWLNRGASVGEFKGQFGISLQDLEYEFNKLKNDLYRKKINSFPLSQTIDYKAIEKECYDEINSEITKRLQGSVGEQKPFMSTAHSKSWGFVDNGEEATANVVYNIYCPKGTKGIYTEPYSAFGNGGRYWDGKSKNAVKNEVEVILQRGTRLRITKLEYKGGQWFIDMEVIEQPIKIANQP